MITWLMEEEKQGDRTSEFYTAKMGSIVTSPKKAKKSDENCKIGDIFLTEKLSQRQSPASLAFLSETHKNPRP